MGISVPAPLGSEEVKEWAGGAAGPPCLGSPAPCSPSSGAVGKEGLWEQVGCLAGESLEMQSWSSASRGHIGSALLPSSSSGREMRFIFKHG